MGLYTFVLNNPLRFVDPDGRDAKKDICKCKVGKAVEVSDETKEVLEKRAEERGEVYAVSNEVVFDDGTKGVFHFFSKKQSADARPGGEKHGVSDDDLPWYKRWVRNVLRPTGGAWNDDEIKALHGLTIVSAYFTAGLGAFRQGLSNAAARVSEEIADTGLRGNPLFKDATSPYKTSSLSKAGRALTKHPELANETSASLRLTLRTDAAINQEAAAQLKNIMRNGDVTVRNLPRYGEVTQYQIPGGFGARWKVTGEFIGFINP